MTDPEVIFKKEISKAKIRADAAYAKFVYAKNKLREVNAQYEKFLARKQGKTLQCYYCNRWFKRLSGAHLKTHGIKIVGDIVYHNGVKVNND